MLNDLIYVLKRIKEVIEKYDLPTLYRNLATYVQQAANGTNPTIQEQIKQTKEQINEAQQELNTEGWSYSQAQVFNKFGAGKFVGANGLKRFNLTFIENSGIPNAVINELNQQGQELAQLLTNTNNILNSLGSLAELEKNEEGRGLIQIVFKEDVAIDNLSDLSKQSETWEHIIRAYSILADEAPENTKIIATNKINPLFLWLSAPPLISNALNATVKPMLELWEKYLELQKNALALKEQKINVADKHIELMERIHKHEDAELVKILEAVAGQYVKAGLSEGKKNEGRNNLLKYGRDLYMFIKAHGEVDASENGESTSVTSNLRLAAKYEEIYRLEERVNKMLKASDEDRKEQKASKGSSNKAVKDEPEGDIENKK